MSLSLVLRIHLNMKVCVNYTIWMLHRWWECWHFLDHEQPLASSRLCRGVNHDVRSLIIGLISTASTTSIHSWYWPSWPSFLWFVPHTVTENVPPVIIKRPCLIRHSSFIYFGLIWLSRRPGKYSQRLPMSFWKNGRLGDLFQVVFS